MAGLSEIVIEALRRIAKTDPDISSALGALQKRGIIDGISSTLGGEDGTGSDESCCSDNEAKEVEDPKDPWSEGEAPPEITTTPEGVTDCATGQSVSFEPQGFPQAETCKECGPDETWKQETYWRAKTGAIGDGFGSTLDQAILESVSDYNSTVGRGYDVTSYQISSYSENSAIVEYTLIGLFGQGEVTREDPATRIDCDGSTEDYCTITEAPEICGDNWSPDGSTAYTLRHGCIVASKCDTDAPSGDLGCNQCKTLCKDGVEWQVCATIDGGMIWTDPSGAANGGKYDETGKRTEILNPGETGGYI